MEIHVGVEEKESCIIGILDTEHIPPSAPHLKLVYINYYNKSNKKGIIDWIVAGKEELIYRNLKNQ